MKDIKTNLRIIFALTLLCTLSSCNSQTKKNDSDKIVGGPCQDCDALLDYKKLNYELNSVDTLQGFETKSPKIKITGTVLNPDRKTPAADVILYVYQTNQKGIYEPSENPVSWERRHGKFRAWMKTDTDGKFTLYTFRPGAYPDGREPEHIHLYIKEPGKTVYYVDSYQFADDPMLTEKEKNGLQNRAGSGVVTLKNTDGLLTAKRDIILGLNIPDY